jgi:opacity protein-like surface antigen
MKKMLIVAVTAACFSVNAQTANFEGFSTALNLNTVSTNSKISAEGNSVLDGIGQQSWKGSIQAAYGFATGSNNVVSVGATYVLGNIEAGYLGDLGGVKIRAKNVYSLYVEPGFLINDKTLAYGKLSYEGAKGQSPFPEANDVSRSMRGKGLGLGVRTLLDNSLFIQVEFKQVTYNRLETLAFDGFLKSKATMGTIGIGKKF